MVALLKMPSRSSFPGDPGVRRDSTARTPKAAPATLRLDRRRFPRRRVEAQVQGRRLDHSLEARQQPRLMLSMQDLSDGGLSATSECPLECGEQVTVHFPPKGQSHDSSAPMMRLTTSSGPCRSFGGWDAYGHVVRCVPAGNGYAVAIAFDSLPAA